MKFTKNSLHSRDEYLNDTSNISFPLRSSSVHAIIFIRMLTGIILFTGEKEKLPLKKKKKLRKNIDVEYIF